MAAPPDKLRVLSIAHSLGSDPSAQKRYVPLATLPDLDTHVLAPSEWREFGRTMRTKLEYVAGISNHLASVRWGRAPGVSWYLHHYPELGGLLRRLRPDVIHLWEESWSIVALQAVLLRRRILPAAAIVLEVDQNILRRLSPPFQQIRHYVFQHVDYLLARSQDAVDVARASGYRGPAGLIYYGVDTTTFHPGDRAARRVELGVSGFVVGYVGRLVAEKGIDDIMEAMALSAAPITLVIVGEGPHLAALKQRAARLAIQPRIRILGWASHEHVARIMQALDALVLLTRTTRRVREQFGRVIIEAQACGVPVIGSSCGSIPHIVGDGGWVVPESAPAQLASLLDRLANCPNEVQAAGARGVARVAGQFTYEHVASTLAAAWRSSADARRLERPA
jgi:glycosyltransferase involved in cell wall biosynthesis